MSKRHWGCRITENVLQDGFRILTLENKTLKTTILLDKGADIYEFIYKPADLDFMWHYRELDEICDARYYPSTESTSFMDFYEGCWQELFPSAGPDTAMLNAHMPQHGEVCNARWDYRVLRDEPDEISVLLWVKTKRSPFLVEKKLTIRGGEPLLKISHSIKNEGADELPFLLGQHPAIGERFLSTDCEIRTSAATVFSAHFLTGDCQRMKENTSYKWPFVQGRQGEVIDLSKVPKKDSGTSDMYYLKDFEGDAWYTIFNKKFGFGFHMEWDSEFSPYLWMWQLCGGSHNYPFYGCTYNLALEPHTSFHDRGYQSAYENGTACMIKGGQVISTWYTASVVF